MSFVKTTDQLVLLCEDILRDIPKALNGNRSAAQRVRTGTVKLSKVAKDWRRLSIQQEKKPLKKSRTRRKKS